MAQGPAKRKKCPEFVYFILGIKSNFILLFFQNVAGFKIMKNLSFAQKILLIFTWIFAILLLLAYLNPYIPVNLFPQLSLLSLIFPLLVSINLIFLIYWLVNLKKYFVIPLLILLLNYNNLNRLYQWKGKHSYDGEGITIMSYNVRLFNDYQQIKRKAVDVDISNFLKDQHPDILLLQEFRPGKKTDFSQYQYKKLGLKGKRKQMGVVIFSKFPIINSGGFDFSNTYNNAVWADIKMGNDTVRVYNVHMQSHSVHPENINNQDKLVVTHKISEVFKKQYFQAEQVKKHMEKSKYPVILGGDFNNTAFSATYRLLKGNKYDAFVQAGQGFGFTWYYKYFPFRIDFLMIDQSFFVKEYKTFSYVKYSDHKPIQAMIKLK